MSGSATGRAILCLYCEPWESPLRTSKHHLMGHFAQRGRVLYVEMPAHPAVALGGAGRFRQALRRAADGVRQVADNIFALSPLVPLPYHARAPLLSGLWTNRLNQRMALRAIRSALARLEMERPIVWFYFPHGAVLLDDLPHALVCYHVVDDYLAFKGIPRSLATVEQTLLARADLVVASSDYLCQVKGRLAPRIHLVRHGVDAARFGEGGAMPADLAPFRRPRLGYFGALHKLDLDLCREMARRRPDWSFLFVGPVTGPQGADVGRLAGMPNVRVLGPRPYEAMPAYLGSVDGAIMPFALTALTTAMSPIKVYEALAAGKPVVSTPVPELTHFGDLVCIAGDAEGLVTAVEACLREPAHRGEERKRFAAENTWERRFAEIERLLSEALERRGRDVARGR